MADKTLDLLNQTQIELLQKYDGALNRFNEINNYFEDGKAIEAINAEKLDGFKASQNPSSRQIPVLNNRGQLQLPFSQDPILVNNQELLNRKFYVDAENGDDTNDGTEGAPFASIKKAIWSVPIGGRAYIYLKAGQTFTLTNYIEIADKSIMLHKWEDGDEPNPIVTSQEHIVSESNGNYDALYPFFVANGTLAFTAGVDIVIPDHSGSNPMHPLLKSLVIPKYNNSGPAVIRAHYCNITLNKDFRFVECSNYGGGVEGLFFQLLGTTIIVNDESSILVNVYHSPLILGYMYNSITDNTGSGKTLKDLIAGLVSDGNGFYKNLVGDL